METKEDNIIIIVFSVAFLSSAVLLPLNTSNHSIYASRSKSRFLLRSPTGIGEIGQKTGPRSPVPVKPGLLSTIGLTVTQQIFDHEMSNIFLKKFLEFYDAHPSTRS